MKLACFDDFKLGVVKGADALGDVKPIVKEAAQGDPRLLINALIEKFAEYRKRLESAVSEGKAIPLASVKLRPPVPRPGNIDCMAVNYIEEMIPTPPPINGFQKSSNAIIGPGDTMILPDAPATIFEGEAELGVVIGKRASNVSAANAMDYVFGYVNLSTARRASCPRPATRSIRPSRARPSHPSAPIW